MTRVACIASVSAILGFIAAIELFWNDTTRRLAREHAHRHA